jgi:hypothetical protein
VSLHFICCSSPSPLSLSFAIMFSESVLQMFFYHCQ